MNPNTNPDLSLFIFFTLNLIFQYYFDKSLVNNYNSSQPFELLDFDNILFSNFPKLLINSISSLLNIDSIG